MKYFRVWSPYNGNTFIKCQLEILLMDNKCCFTTPLYWIPKISFIPTVCNICKIKPIVYPMVIALFSTITGSKGICIVSFYVKYFFLLIGFGLKVPKNSIPLLHFCLKKLNNDFKINLYMVDFSMASSPELHEIVFPENCIIHN